MEKQRKQRPIKEYAALFAFCAIFPLIGVINSGAIKASIHLVGEKPPFLTALFILVLSLAGYVAAASLTYLSWFYGKKARKNLTKYLGQLADRSFFFRLPIYNPTFMLWFIRFISPVYALFFLGLFFLFLFNAF